MDNLTHTLVGAALGEAGLKKYSGLATAALLIGANASDIDILAVPFGANLTFRRGWTHGPVAMLVLPAVITGALVAWDRIQAHRGKRPESRGLVRPVQLFLISLLAVLSHPFLDWLNTYGVRLLMPFSEKWFYGDSIFIIDPWIWIVLAAGVVLSRRRAREGDTSATLPARFALILLGTYIGLMFVGSARGRQVAIRHLGETEARAPRRVMAGPVPANPFRRSLIYDMGDHYRFGDLLWRQQPRVIIGSERLPTNLNHPLARSARARGDVQEFLRWARFPFFEIPAIAEPSFIELSDARFASPGRGRSPFRLRIPTRDTTFRK